MQDAFKFVHLNIEIFANELQIRTFNSLHSTCGTDGSSLEFNPTRGYLLRRFRRKTKPKYHGVFATSSGIYFLSNGWVVLLSFTIFMLMIRSLKLLL